MDTKMRTHRNSDSQSLLVVLGTVGLLNSDTWGVHGFTKLSHGGTGTICFGPKIP